MAGRRVSGAVPTYLTLVKGGPSKEEVEAVVKDLSGVEKRIQSILKAVRVAIEGGPGTVVTSPVPQPTARLSKPVMAKRTATAKTVAKPTPTAAASFKVGDQVTYTGQGLSRKLKAGDQCTVKWTDGKYVTVMRNKDKFYTDLAVSRLQAMPGAVAKQQKVG
jgi:hypothetical protein